MTAALSALRVPAASTGFSTVARPASCASVRAPTHVLQPTWTAYGLDGLMKPRMDYTTSFCNYECRVCGEACPSGAIMLLDLAEKQVTQIGEAIFEKEKCIVVVKARLRRLLRALPHQAVYTIPYGDNLHLPTGQPRTYASAAAAASMPAPPCLPRPSPVQPSRARTGQETG